ncbi:MAG: peptidase [Bradyrhizobiaceae bacterium]|nr:MAG: peptidase [Bradyrhizobiaceae bacterium]
MKTAPYGAWKSPITSDLIVAQSIALGDVRIDGGQVYWLEGRPQEQGRNVIVRADGAEVTPKPFNARTRVHEYGGGAWLVADGSIVFSHVADGRLYRQAVAAGAPVPLTPAPPDHERNWRFADGVIDRRRGRWIGVREDHTGEGEAVNAIVAVDLAGPEDAGRLLAGGHDFVASPRLSPDGRHLMWLAWDHPNMPWNGTTLYLAELDTDGLPSAPRAIAGGARESIFQPEWRDDGKVLFVSDRSGWWNLHGYDLASGATAPLLEMEAEFGQPQWVFGMSTYALAGSDRLVCSYTEQGLGRLAVLELATGRRAPLDLPFTEFAAVRAEGDRVAFLAGAPDRPTSVVTLDLATGVHRVLKTSTDILARADLRIADHLTRVEPVAFPSGGGRTAHGLFYPPHNPDYAAPPGEKPPLLVKCHGGPTSSASSTLSLRNQFWTSRGIAVLDVNYGGSTGFGRAYRERLHGNWGVVDVEDCINGAKHLAAQGRVDGARAVISGGSAGGYTVLAALVFHDFFQGGASHYGVSDIAALARDTHKFESRYLDWLIGPYPQAEELYRQRSPLHHAERLSKPVIFFQGEEDRIVPPNQTEAMVEALRRKGNPVGYLLFAGEQHGFRQAGNIQRSLDAELYFFAIQVFRTGLTF